MLILHLNTRGVIKPRRWQPWWNTSANHHPQHTLDNESHTNLGKGDIARLLSITSITFARWKHAWRSWSELVHLGPTNWGREGRRGSAIVPFESGDFVTIALSLTIWPQFVIECLWRSNQQRGR